MIINGVIWRLFNVTSSQVTINESKATLDWLFLPLFSEWKIWLRQLRWRNSNTFLPKEFHSFIWQTLFARKTLSVVFLYTLMALYAALLLLKKQEVVSVQENISWFVPIQNMWKNLDPISLLQPLNNHNIILIPHYCQKYWVTFFNLHP